jgi:hypothetical protein
MDMVRSQPRERLGEAEGRPEATQLILGCLENPNGLRQASVLQTDTGRQGQIP